MQGTPFTVTCFWKTVDEAHWAVLIALVGIVSLLLHYRGCTRILWFLGGFFIGFLGEG